MTLSWVRRNVTLQRAWIIYFIWLVIFILVAIEEQNNFILLQLGSILFTIVIMYLIMITGNIELQKSTREQADAFVKELGRVDSELKDVVSSLLSLTNVMSEIQRITTQQADLQKAIYEGQEAEKRKRVQRLKPRIFCRIEPIGLNFIIDFRHYHVFIDNAGGNAQEVWISVSSKIRKSFGPNNILPNTPIDLDIGPFNEFSGLESVPIELSCKDIERRLYSGRGSLMLSNKDWQEISLNEAD